MGAMSDFNLVTPAPPSMNERYDVLCWKCEGTFDAASAPWCNDGKLRTLLCSHCHACFCQAPGVYKRKFWNEAPRSLREHTGRFCVPTRPALPAGIQVPQAPAADSARRPHVLIVDDEEP